MSPAFGIPRKLIILAIILPLAVFLGYMMATPDSGTSFLAVGAVVAVLLVPLCINYHYPILVFAINASVDIFFLPGKPHLWMLMGVISLALTLLGKILNKSAPFVNVEPVTWSLLALAGVVILTMMLTGGIGLRSMGSNLYGGKKAMWVLFAVTAYFALSLQPVPKEKAQSYTGFFLLSSLTSMMSNLIYIGGPGLWWLYLFFPVEFALGQAVEDFGMSATGIRFSRLMGFAPAALGLISFMLMRNGIRGLFDLTKPYRLVLLIGTLLLCLMSGFRSSVVIFGLIFCFQFWFEGLVRTRLFPYAVLGGILAFTALIPLGNMLPLSIQRSLTIIPFVQVSQVAKIDAFNSSQWRLEMWAAVVPDIPKYFWLGKGFATSATEHYMAVEAVRRGHIRDFETAILAGDYHSGPLSVILPLGIWGVVAFLVFLWIAWRSLYRNYRYGDPELKNINTFLLAYFAAKTIYFFAVFGALHTDMILFCGLLGLSVSLNRGVASPKDVVARAPEP